MNHPAPPCPSAAHALRGLAAALLLAGAGAWAGTAPIEPDLAERVRGLVNSHLPAAGPAGGGAPRVSIEIGQLDPRLRLAPCQRVEPRLPPDGRLWGRTRIGLRCVEGERKWQVWLPVVVRVVAPALVPVRTLPAGSVLSAGDLAVADVDWAAGPQPPFVKPAELVGRTLGRSLQAGEAVRAGDLRQRQWFAAGDTVQVLARGNGFVVGGEGQAMGPGIEGREVRVRTESGRVLTGVPVGDRRVEVLL